MDQQMAGMKVTQMVVKMAVETVVQKVSEQAETRDCKSAAKKGS